MARIVKPLNDKEIREAKPKDKIYKLLDGGGLQLKVFPNGKKKWLMDYIKPVSKKRSSLSLGSYPALSLKAAREKLRTNKDLLANGIDPVNHKQQQQLSAQLNAQNTLLAVASQWFEVKRSRVSADYADDVWRSLELHVFSNMGQIPIGDITAPEAIVVLKRLEASGSLEQVRRVIQRLNEIMTFAVNTGVIVHNPLAGIKDAFLAPKKFNFPSIPPSELPNVFKNLLKANIKITTRMLIEWQLHTMVRPGEAVCARWEDIDLERKIWTLPPDIMKMKREHIVPLTDASIAILDFMKDYSGHREYVFPGDRQPKQHMNESTANAALRRAGYKGVLVAHGFRSIASTALNEQGFNPDAIEHALAHLDKNQIRAAYNRSNYLEERRNLMEWWSQYILKSKQG